MKFSIITPSFNQLSYLKRCVASVADQGVEIEHIVIDGGSTDGTVEWLTQQVARYPSACPVEEYSTGNSYRLTFISEADKGMYDALNKGFDRAAGDILAWLNCDEQYLPDTLHFVQDWFASHLQVEVLCGGALLTRPDGSLLAFRKAVPLRRHYLASSHLYNLSCGMFFRRGVWDRGIRFDPSYRNLGDQEWIMRLLRDGVRTGVANRLLSAFGFTGANMSQTEEAQDEQKRLVILSSAWARRLRKPLTLLRWSEKVLRGAYCRRPFDYAVYPDENADRRKIFHAEKASFQWPEK